MTNTPEGDPRSPIRVVVVDDHEMVAEGLALGLDGRPGILIVGVAGTIQEGLATVAAQQPDVVLMDYRLPDGDGAAGTIAVKEIASDTAVIMLTAGRLEDVAADALASGCAGLVPKGASMDDVAAAIRVAYDGGTSFTLDALTAGVERTSSADAIEDLTIREVEVLHLLSRGASTTEIADELTLSVHTVRNHIRHVMAKLDAHSRVEALAIARRERLIED